MPKKAPSIISVVNQKGGTGKTTSTVNIGAALAKMGRKVLLIDMDSQGNMTFHLGLQTDFEKSLAHLISGEASFEEVMLEKEGMHVIPSDVSLADIEISLVNTPNREFILKNILKDISHRYEYILMDCGPSLSMLTVNALTASNKVLIPLQLEVLSLQGLTLITDTVFNIKEALNSELSIMGILMVMVDVRRKVTHEIMEYIKENFGMRIFETTIGIDVHLVEAPSFGESALAYSPLSTGSMQYMKVAREIAQLEESNN